MLPTLQIEDVHVAAYAVAFLAAFAVGALFACQRLIGIGVSSSVAELVITASAVGGVVAAVAVSAWLTQARFASDGVFARPEGASVVWGLAGSMAAGAVVCRRLRLPVWRVLDAAAQPILLGLAIVRLGCLAAGCCYGQETDSPLALYLPDVHGQWADRYPTQLVSGLANLAFFVVLRLAERRTAGGLASGAPPPDGWQCALAIVLYGVKRFALAPWRADAGVAVGPLSWMQFSALVALAAVAVIAWRLRRSDPAPQP
jgi:phosphatidylglycerol:prolipoprotein diacylglycerol transferase